MTREEREAIIREFQEAKALVERLNNLTHRIEKAADRAIEAYTSNGNGDTHASD